MVSWLSLIVLFVIYLGKVNTKLPAALIAIVVGAGIDVYKRQPHPHEVFGKRGHALHRACGV